MEENPDRDREEVPGRPAASPENMREQNPSTYYGE